MSKHASADEKLHVPAAVRPKSAVSKRQLNDQENTAPQVPPKGTNANNQYR